MMRMSLVFKRHKTLEAINKIEAKLYTTIFLA